jgi:hypothetical protein
MLSEHLRIYLITTIWGQNEMYPPNGMVIGITGYVRVISSVPGTEDAVLIRVNVVVIPFNSIPAAMPLSASMKL